MILRNMLIGEFKVWQFSPEIHPPSLFGFILCTNSGAQYLSDPLDSFRKIYRVVKSTKMLWCPLRIVNSKNRPSRSASSGLVRKYKLQEQVQSTMQLFCCQLSEIYIKKSKSKWCARNSSKEWVRQISTPWVSTSGYHRDVITALSKVYLCLNSFTKIEVSLKAFQSLKILCKAIV